jgi:predicted secreted protein
MRDRQSSSRRFAASALAALLLAFVAVVMFGRAMAITLQTDAKSADSIVNVTEAENGKEIDLATGQVLRLKLKSIPGTGYAWTLDGDPAPLKLVKSFTQRKKSTSGMAGAPQMSVFQLKANSAGLATVTFVYRRSWEYNVPPAKTFSVRVNAR